METIDSILRKAVRLGACSGSSKATDWKSLCWLFFTPQGREFCGKNNYPSIDMFRNMKSYVRPYNVYVDEDVVISNEDIALIGSSESSLFFSGTDKVYKIILMHGAKAVINVGKYAVIRIENMGGSYDLNNDGTAEVLV